MRRTSWEETAARIFRLPQEEWARLAPLAEQALDPSEGPPTYDARTALHVLQDRLLEADLLAAPSVDMLEIRDVHPWDDPSEVARLLLLEEAYLAAHLLAGRWESTVSNHAGAIVVAAQRDTVGRPAEPGAASMRFTADPTTWSPLWSIGVPPNAIVSVRAILQPQASTLPLPTSYGVETNGTGWTVGRAVANYEVMAFGAPVVVHATIRRTGGGAPIFVVAPEVQQVPATGLADRVDLQIPHRERERMNHPVELVVAGGAEPESWTFTIQTHVVTPAGIPKWWESSRGKRNGNAELSRIGAHGTGIVTPPEIPPVVALNAESLRDAQTHAARRAQREAQRELGRRPPARRR